MADATSTSLHAGLGSVVIQSEKLCNGLCMHAKSIAQLLRLINQT